MNIDIDYIRKNKNSVNWDIIVKQNLSEEFIKEFKSFLDCKQILVSKQLSDKFLKEIFFYNYPLYEKWIYKNDKNYNAFDFIVVYQKLSESFLEMLISKKHIIDYPDWQIISETQNLSENFIRKYKNELWWSCISAYQKLSDVFIIEMSDYIDYRNLKFNKNLKYILKESKFIMSVLIL